MHHQQVVLNQRGVEFVVTDHRRACVQFAFCASARPGDRHHVNAQVLQRPDDRGCTSTGAQHQRPLVGVFQKG